MIARPWPRMERAELRRALLAARAAMTAAERVERSEAAQRALIASDWFARAGTVLLYLDFRGEVETGLLAAEARAQGKRLVLPRVQKAPRRLWLHHWVGEPVTGAYGILEPAADWPLVSPAEIELAVVPGVGFDRAGNRLGYGGGYYDRTLAGLTRAVRVGLAFELQVVERLAAEPHDVPLDGLATEGGLISCGRSL